MEMSCSELGGKMETLSLVSTVDHSPHNQISDFDNLSYPQNIDPCSREQYQKDRLSYVLKKQEEERKDTTFSRDCLFCKKHFTGNRSLLFQHLNVDHNFFVGAPDNIVFGNELLDVLSEKLKNLQCLFCEKTFKEYQVLKEHMRKKQHKQINPNNKAYDKFYIINYLELGKNWAEVQREKDTYYESDNEDADDEYMECEEENLFQCLLCTEAFKTFEWTLAHMKDVHQFDYVKMKDEHGLDFYKQVKLVNFIRRQVSLLICVMCGGEFPTQRDLLNHLESSQHLKYFPDPEKWDQAMYFFPTNENDNFLCSLEDEDEDYSSCDEYLVVSEDILVPELRTEEVLQMLK